MTYVSITTTVDKKISFLSRSKKYLFYFVIQSTFKKLQN